MNINNIIVKLINKVYYLYTELYTVPSDVFTARTHYPQYTSNSSDLLSNIKGVAFLISHGQHAPKALNNTFGVIMRRRVVHTADSVQHLMAN